MTMDKEQETQNAENFRMSSFQYNNWNGKKIICMISVQYFALKYSYVFLHVCTVLVCLKREFY
jgi:hypothetical protein